MRDLARAGGFCGRKAPCMRPRRGALPHSARRDRKLERIRGVARIPGHGETSTAGGGAASSWQPDSPIRMSGNGKNGRRRVAAGALRCQPDARLVRLVREGHADAFEEIVRRYRAPLVAYAGRVVPDHRAEDVVQEALTRAHFALSGSRGEMKLRPWLFTIVRNGALNALRNEPVHAHLDESYDGVTQPPEVAARREELAALTASLKALPDQQREALVKRELEGRSHSEIAASLGLSSGAVRGLIYRARAALRDGAGMLIPLPVVRALLDSTSATPEATGAAGAAAAGLAGGGGGVALKAGATLGVAVIAVGSGIAVQSRNSGSARGPTTTAGPSHAVHAHDTDGSGRPEPAETAALPGSDGRSGHGGEGSASAGPGGGDNRSTGSGGPGPAGRTGGGPPSGGGSDTEGAGGRHGGSASTGGDGIGGTGGGGNDGVGSSTSGHGGGGSSGSGSDDRTFGGSGDGHSGDGHGGEGGSGSSGSGSSGSASSGDGDTTTTVDGGSSGDGGGGTTTDGGVDGSAG